MVRPRHDHFAVKSLHGIVDAVIIRGYQHGVHLFLRHRNDEPVSRTDLQRFDLTGRRFGKVEEDKGQYDTVVNVDWTTGACMCVRTKIYKESGGLDAAFFAHQEEIDLCWRMRNQGWTLACVPQSTVYHLGGGALSYDNPRKTYLNFRNNLLMIYKNSRCRWGVLSIRFFLDIAAACMFLVTGKKGSAKAVLEARKDYHKMRKNYHH